MLAIKDITCIRVVFGRSHQHDIRADSLFYQFIGQLHGLDTNQTKPSRNGTINYNGIEQTLLLLYLDVRVL